MKNIQFRISVITLIFSLLVLGSCGKQKTKGGSADEERIFPVEVTSVTRGDIEDKIIYLGNIEAFEQVDVYSTIPTRITEIKVDVNDEVEEGQVLAIVDNIKIRQAVLQAEAGLSSAKAQFENVNAEWQRIERLYKENAISQSQYDAVKAQREAASAMVEQLTAGLNSAKEQMKDSSIKASISGIISARNYNLGDQTSPQIPAFTIVTMKKLRIYLNVVEGHIGQVKAGQKAYIQVSAYPGMTFEAVVNKIYPTVDPMTRTIKTEIIIDNSKLRLKPGMYANVQIVTKKRQNVLLIQKQSIIDKTSLEHLGGEVTNTRISISEFVFVIDGDRANQVEIQTGIEDAGYVEVTGGLDEGAWVVTLGQFNLVDGSKVEVLE